MSDFENWIVLGAGNLIRDIKDAIESRGGTLVGVVTNQPLSEKVSKAVNAPIITIENFSSHFGTLQPLARGTLTNLGYTKFIFGFLNSNKEQFLSQLPPTLRCSNLIHAKAYIGSDVQMGFGNYLGPMAVIAPGTTLGSFNYLNRCASIGHDVEVGNFNHFGPNSTICGNCKIGNKNYFGAGSTVIDGKSIKDSITLGAGGVLIANIEIPGTYIGVPAELRLPFKQD